MQDLSYTEALAAAAEPHEVLLGPAPCHTCGAWVEWAGTDWLALDSTERHDCAVYLQLGLAPGWMDQAHPMTATIHEHPDSWRRDLLLVAAGGLLLIALAWLAQTLRAAQGGGDGNEARGIAPRASFYLASDGRGAPTCRAHARTIAGRRARPVRLLHPPARRAPAGAGRQAAGVPPPRAVRHALRYSHLWLPGLP